MVLVDDAKLVSMLGSILISGATSSAGDGPADAVNLACAATCVIQRNKQSVRAHRRDEYDQCTHVLGQVVENLTTKHMRTLIG